MKNIFRYIVVLIFVIGAFLAPAVSAQVGGPNPWKVIGSAIRPIISSWTLGSSASRIAKGWFTDLDSTTLTAGTITISGAVSGDLDVGGKIQSGSSNLDITNTTGNLLLSGGTLGSIFFAGTSGILAQDNANLFWDDTNNWLGIGTTTPSSKLDVTTAALGTTQTTSSGLALVNTTAAAAGAQQISPAIRGSGFGWKTDAIAASQAVDFRSYVVPVQGAANPTGYLAFESSINGGAYSATPAFVITSAGNIGIGTTGPEGTLDVH